MKQSKNHLLFETGSVRGDLELCLTVGNRKGLVEIFDVGVDLNQGYKIKTVGKYGYNSSRYIRPEKIQFVKDSEVLVELDFNIFDFDSLMKWNVEAVDILHESDIKVPAITSIGNYEQTVSQIMRFVDENLVRLFLQKDGSYELQPIESKFKMSNSAKIKFIDKRVKEVFPSFPRRRDEFSFYFRETNLVEQLNKLYLSRESSLEFIPPSERRSLVIEATVGCDYNACTFCNCYSADSFAKKSIDDILENLNDLRSFSGFKLRYLDKFFIGTGNALSMPAEDLLKIIYWINSRFDDANISLYGRVNDILSKSNEELFELSRSGLSMVYWGVESGSDNVLKYVNKGQTYEQMLEASEKLRNNGIRQSVMIMPGLGGIKYFDEHLEETSEFLSHARPHYITFLGINPDSSTKYFSKMQIEMANGLNRPLTEREIILQIRGIIDRTDLFGGKYGMHSPLIDRVGSNPINFNDALFDDFDKLTLLREIDSVYNVTQ
ncbi:radical SAM protein [Candidatus Woesearchaeota archaeon]|nr:radical SAM protein [Candidatus Woesearchaeota archaeon]